MTTTDWKAVYAKKDIIEAERQKRQRDELRRLSSSAPSQKTTFASLFSGSSYPGSGGGTELRQRHISATALVEPHARDLAVERGIERLSDQMGVISQVLHGIDQNIEQNHHTNLDRFDGLRAQITRENQRLMGAIRSIRRESDCDLSDPTTYIHCLKLIYILIFRIFKFLCELIFVVGNSFKDFLSHMPFPFSLLVFIAYIFQMILIWIIFDTTIRVSTLGVSHRQFIPHNALFGHSNGAPDFISARDALYQGLFRSGLFALSQIIALLGAAYQAVLGRDIEMIQRETARYISSDTVVQGVKHHVVEPLAEKAAEQVQAVVNDVVNDQVGIMASIPGQLGELAVKGAQGAGSLAQGAASLAGRGIEGAGSIAGKALEGAGSLAGKAAEGLAARAEKIRQIDHENVKDSARAAAEVASEAAQHAMHAGRRFTSAFKSKFFGGSRRSRRSRRSLREMTKTKNRGRNKERNHLNVSRANTNRKSRSSRSSRIDQIPVFSILTKTEQKVFDKTIAGRRLKQLEQMIHNIDYSKIQPNPQLFTTIKFVLNVAERLFPIFIQQLDRTVKICKIMKGKGVKPISNQMFLKQLGQIVSIKQ
jgi:hypothetical protein